MSNDNRSCWHTIRVPGSSANMGNAFDTLGLPWALRCTLSFRRFHADSITGIDGHLIPITSTSNLFFHALDACHEALGLEQVGVELSIRNELPWASEFGSSLTVYITAIIETAAIHGDPIDKRSSFLFSQ